VPPLKASIGPRPGNPEGSQPASPFRTSEPLFRLSISPRDGKSLLSPPLPARRAQGANGARRPKGSLQKKPKVTDHPLTISDL
jgi:hypothetical protein